MFGKRSKLLCLEILVSYPVNHVFTPGKDFIKKSPFKSMLSPVKKQLGGGSQLHWLCPCRNTVEGEENVFSSK